jgi:predicted esterase
MSGSKDLTRFVVCAVFICFFLNGITHAEEEFAGIVNKSLFVGGDQNKRYFLIGDEFMLRSPNARFGLVLVLPGGDGAEDFNRFVQRIFKHALSKKYIVAQLVAVKWSEDQRVIWPTKKTKAAGQKFSTEEFVKSVIEDIGSKYRLDGERIFTLSWSSGGPAGYAVSLDTDIGVTGSFVAMSVFKPHELRSLEAAKGHGYFIYHSPEDKICPFDMAKEARRVLGEKGAKVKLITYDGGHGWRGSIYSRIRYGIRWLEKNHGQAKVVTRKAIEVGASTKPGKASVVGNFIFNEDFERGQDVPNGWQKGATVNGVSYVWDKKTAFKGKASLCLKKTGQKYFPVAQWFRKYSHDGISKELKVNVKVKAEQMTKAIVDVQFTDADEQWLGHEWAVYIGARKPSDRPANHNWKDYGGTVEIPEGTETIVVALQIYGPGSVWFDELAGRYVVMEWPSEVTQEKAVSKADVKDVGIAPLEGIGPIRFGMTREEVEKQFGEPEVVEGAGVGLQYLAGKGITMMLHPELGVIGIDCWSERYPYPMTKIKTYEGKTKEGIGLASGREAILAAYGEPDQTYEEGRMEVLYYEKLKMRVRFLQGEAVNIRLEMTR